MSDTTGTGYGDGPGGDQQLPPRHPLPWLQATIETGDFAVALRRGDAPHVRYDEIEAIAELYAAGETPGVLLYRPHHLLALSLIHI